MCYWSQFVAAVKKKKITHSSILSTKEKYKLNLKDPKPFTVCAFVVALRYEPFYFKSKHKRDSFL